LEHQLMLCRQSDFRNTAPVKLAAAVGNDLVSVWISQSAAGDIDNVSDRETWGATTK
jgi:hypothetical protein